LITVHKNVPKFQKKKASSGRSKGKDHEKTKSKRTKTSVIGGSVTLMDHGDEGFPRGKPEKKVATKKTSINDREPLSFNQKGSLRSWSSVEKDFKLYVLRKSYATNKKK